jgi:undecaprenyl-diphosphatase
MQPGSLDYTLFHAVNGFAGRVAWVDQLAVWFAQWSPYLMVGLLAVLWFRRRGEASLPDREASVHAGFAVVLALLVNFAIAAVWSRDRPFVDHPAHLLVARTTDPSFPSDHASAAFAIAVAVFLYDRRFGTVLLGIASLMAVDRVFIGLHFPGDVLAGTLVGTGVAVALLAVRRELALVVRAVNLVWARMGLP